MAISFIGYQTESRRPMPMTGSVVSMKVFGDNLASRNLPVSAY